MAFPIKRYAVLKDGKIIRDYFTADGIEGIHQSIHNEGLDHDEIIDVPTEGIDLKVGTHKDEYEAGWKFKPLSERVALGHFKLPENHKVENNTVVPMTIEERWKAGKHELHPRMKAVGNDVVPKTDAEIVAEGLATQAQLDEERQIAEDEKIIAEESAKILRAQAIANAGSKLKKVIK